MGDSPEANVFVGAANPHQIKALVADLYRRSHRVNDSRMGAAILAAALAGWIEAGECYRSAGPRIFK